MLGWNGGVEGNRVCLDVSWGRSFAGSFGWGEERLTKEDDAVSTTVSFLGLFWDAWRHLEGFSRIDTFSEEERRVVEVSRFFSASSGVWIFSNVCGVWGVFGVFGVFGVLGVSGVSSACDLLKIASPLFLLGVLFEFLVLDNFVFRVANERISRFFFSILDWILGCWSHWIKVSFSRMYSSANLYPYISASSAVFENSRISRRN